MLLNFDHIIDVRQWHKLRVIMKGCQVQAFFDEKQVFDLCDKTFREGHVGLRTKSDAVTTLIILSLKIYREIVMARHKDRCDTKRGALHIRHLRCFHRWSPLF